MKTKNKTLAIVEIVIVLCSLFLVALPATAIAAEQTTHEVSAAEVTTASEDDYVLGVYGNANEDDTIDMRDVTYTKLVIFGKKTVTELADAYYDDEVDVLDVVQIKLIILGRESELTIVDSADRIVTIAMPVERTAGIHTSPCREFCMLGVEDKVVGVTKYILDDLDMYPGLEGKPDIGSIYEPYYEVIAEADPDVLITTSSTTYLGPILEKLEPMGIKVIALDLHPVKDLPPEEVELIYDLELRQLGYIFDKEERADKFIEWRDEIFDLIKDQTKDLKDEEKARVFGTNLGYALKGETEFHPWFGEKFIALAGGIDIASDYSEKVSGEWLLEENPDAIIFASYYTEEGFGYSVTDETLAEQSLSTVLDHEVIGETMAAKEEMVYIFGYYGIGSGGQTQLGAAYLAKRLYPELFDDINPEEFQKEYFEEWFDIPYQGVWVYP